MEAFISNFSPAPVKVGGLNKSKFPCLISTKPTMLSTELNPAPDGEVARVFLLHADDQVLAVRHVGVLRLGVHLLEILHALQLRLADLDPHHVIDFAGINGQFAAQHLVLGLDVALDVDFLDVTLLALLDVVGNVDRPGRPDWPRGWR